MKPPSLWLGGVIVWAVLGHAGDCGLPPEGQWATRGIVNRFISFSFLVGLVSELSIGEVSVGVIWATRSRQHGLFGGVGVDDLFLNCVEGDKGNAVGDVASP